MCLVGVYNDDNIRGKRFNIEIMVLSWQPWQGNEQQVRHDDSLGQDVHSLFSRVVIEPNSNQCIWALTVVKCQEYLTL